MTTSLDRAPGYRLHRVQRRLRAHLLGVLAPMELSPEQYFVLMRLAEAGAEGCVQGDLGDPVLDDRASVSRQVTGLEARGWLSRSPHPEDARAVLVRLSPAGWGLLGMLSPRIEHEREHLFGSLPAADLAALHRVLDHLEARLPEGR